jgi:hypothetical protein
MYIFLDESGQFARHDHENYFVVATFSVGNQRRTDKAMRAWFRSRFPKKICTQSEIKWSNKKIDEELRLRTLKYIAKMDVRIRYGYLLRKNIPNSFCRKGKIESGRLYANVVGEILEKYLPTDEKEIHIFCDRRSLKGMTKKEFELSIRSHLLPLCPSNAIVQVEMIDSTSNANIQISDWIAGAMSYYLEQKKWGEDYYKIFKNNLLDRGIEFFAN